MEFRHQQYIYVFAGTRADGGGGLLTLKGFNYLRFLAPMIGLVIYSGINWIKLIVSLNFLFELIVFLLYLCPKLVENDPR